MATPEQIRRRVEDADTARSARRAAAAQQVGDLARRRAAIVTQLEAIEHELGDVLAGAQDVIGIDELADFTDLKAADLTGWLAGRKPGRGRRRKPSTGAAGTPRKPDPATDGSTTNAAAQASPPHQPALAEGAKTSVQATVHSG
jgi:hypothetical protein